MTGELLRVMVCPPENAGWDDPEKAAAWRELGFQHAPDFAVARAQHEILCRLLSECGSRGREPARGGIAVRSTPSMRTMRRWPPTMGWS